MAGKRAKRSVVVVPVAELRERDYLSLPEFARAFCGKGKDWVYARLVPDATDRAGWVRMPDGVEVPVHRDTNGRWTVARHQYELAKRRAVTEPVAP